MAAQTMNLGLFRWWIGAAAVICACQSETTPAPSAMLASGAGGVEDGANPSPAGSGGIADSNASAAGAPVVSGGVPGANAAGRVPSSSAGSANGGAGSAGAPLNSSCPLPNAAVCLDFEGATPLAGLKLDGDGIDVSQSEHAHGGASLHFGNLTPNKRAWVTTSALSGISNVLWGRFFLYLDAGAPNGHGALVNAFDQAGNYYELGFEFSSFHGNWHVPAGVPERAMNSDRQIPRKAWSCVEFLFDGAQKAEAQIWSNGAPVKYTRKAGYPPIEAVSQFKRVTIGFIAYHGTSLKDYNGDAAPSATQMYIDDIALGPERIGCNQTVQ